MPCIVQYRRRVFLSLLRGIFEVESAIPTNSKEYSTMQIYVDSCLGEQFFSVVDAAVYVQGLLAITITEYAISLRCITSYSSYARKRQLLPRQRMRWLQFEFTLPASNSSHFSDLARGALVDCLIPSRQTPKRRRSIFREIRQ